MAGKTRIGATDLVGSSLVASGWKLISDYVNSNLKYGIFNKDGTPFYQGLVDYDNQVNFFNNPITLGGVDINPLTGKMISGDKSGVNKIIVEAGVVSGTYTPSSNITNAQVEEGAFISINKVIMPTPFTITYVVTGTDKQRDYFLRACKKARKGLDLFTVYMGEQNFSNMNIVNYTPPRDEKNAQMFRVTINLQEIIDTPSPLSLDDATAFSGEGQDIGWMSQEEASDLQKQWANKTQ